MKMSRQQLLTICALCSVVGFIFYWVGRHDGVDSLSGPPAREQRAKENRISYTQYLRSVKAPLLKLRETIDSLEHSASADDISKNIEDSSKTIADLPSAPTDDCNAIWVDLTMCETECRLALNSRRKLAEALMQQKSQFPDQNSIRDGVPRDRKFEAEMVQMSQDGVAGGLRSANKCWNSCEKQRRELSQYLGLDPDN